MKGYYHLGTRRPAGLLLKPRKLETLTCRPFAQNKGCMLCLIRRKQLCMCFVMAECEWITIAPTRVQSGSSWVTHTFVARRNPCMRPTAASTRIPSGRPGSPPEPCQNSQLKRCQTSSFPVQVSAEASNCRRGPNPTHRGQPESNGDSSAKLVFVESWRAATQILQQQYSLGNEGSRLAKAAGRPVACCEARRIANLRPEATQIHAHARATLHAAPTM